MERTDSDAQRQRTLLSRREKTALTDTDQPQVLLISSGGPGLSGVLPQVLAESGLAVERFSCDPGENLAEFFLFRGAGNMLPKHTFRQVIWVTDPLESPNPGEAMLQLASQAALCEAVLRRGAATELMPHLTMVSYAPPEFHPIHALTNVSWQELVAVQSCAIARYFWCGSQVMRKGERGSMLCALLPPGTKRDLRDSGPENDWERIARMIVDKHIEVMNPMGEFSKNCRQPALLTI